MRSRARPVRGTQATELPGHRLPGESRQHSLSDLRRVREEIDRTLRQRQAQTGRQILASVGIGKAVISVGLRADQEHVASELASRYGSAVELRVGFSPARTSVTSSRPAGTGSGSRCTSTTDAAPL